MVSTTQKWVALTIFLCVLMAGKNLIVQTRDLIQNGCDTVVKSFLSDETELLPSTYRDSDSFTFFGNNGKEIPFAWGGLWSGVRAYECCPPVTAIVNQKMQAYLNGVTWIMNTKGKVATSNEAKKIAKLLANPNPLQQQDQFEAQGYVYQQLFGYNIILVVKPFGFKENIDADHLWNIPPYMLDIEETNKLFYQSDLKGILKRVVLTYRGERTTLPIEDIFIMRDKVPNFSNIIFPDSRLKSLSRPISNIIGALDSRGELINYRGARGIFSNEGKDVDGHIPLMPNEEEKLHKDFKEKYGLRHNQRQFIITSANLKWQQIGQDVGQLKLFEEVESSTMMVCDGFGYYYRLLSQYKSASYNDVNEFGKMLYQNTIIPEANSNCQQWDALFNADKYNLKIEKDYSKVPILQADRNKEAQTLNNMSTAVVKMIEKELITINRGRELMGEDTVPGDDVYYSEWIKRRNEASQQNTQTNG